MIYTVTANHRRLAASRMATDGKTYVQLCIKLIVVTGATWSLFLAANLIDVVIVWYLAVFVNSLQGALVGLTFLLKDNVRVLWWQQWMKITCSCRCRFIRHTTDVQQQSATNSCALAAVSGRSTNSGSAGGIGDGDLPCVGHVDLSRIDTKL
ncbi:uncharacterized protein LOC119727011 [Patiria miniata]|uniref:Uncharacterized protein n=1 Tax=Patiria miniata TaxID=46514 RepID=A0A913ZT92_PATMI|nr:uncharacterized protein LOC119727011 [Patiria miniata]